MCFPILESTKEFECPYSCGSSSQLTTSKLALNWNRDKFARSFPKKQKQKSSLQSSPRHKTRHFSFLKLPSSKWCITVHYKPPALILNIVQNLIMDATLLAPGESKFSCNFRDYGTKSSHHFDTFQPESNLNLQATEPSSYTSDIKNKESDPELAVDPQRNLIYLTFLPPSTSFQKTHYFPHRPIIIHRIIPRNANGSKRFLSKRAF